MVVLPFKALLYRNIVYIFKRTSLTFTAVKLALCDAIVSIYPLRIHAKAFKTLDPAQFRHFARQHSRKKQTFYFVCWKTCFKTNCRKPKNLHDLQLPIIYQSGVKRVDLVVPNDNRKTRMTTSLNSDWSDVFICLFRTIRSGCIVVGFTNPALAKT